MHGSCSLLLIFILKNLQWIDASIAGVTYMDNFDFQERYQHINECNPFYWHPLHLPEECIRIFDTLLRSRVGSFSPYSVFKQQEKEIDIYPYTFIETPFYTTEFRQTPPTPFEILFKLLRRDIHQNPSVPTIQDSPYFGSVAVYKQPVSLKSVTMIKKLARAYANAYPRLDINTETNRKYEENKEKIKKKSNINQKTLINGNNKTNN